MEGDLTWFKFRFRWIKVFKTLSKPEMDRLLDAIDAYINSKEMPEMVGRELVAWTFIEPELEDDENSRRKAAEKAAELSEARKNAGSKGGRLKAENSKTKQVVANDSKTKQVVANDSKQNQLLSLRDKELRVKSTEERVNNSCAEAQNSAETPKVTPDNSDFWKFAKENAELAETFYGATGIYPVKSQFGRWVNDLRDLSEAGITPEQLRKTIAYMQSENVTISAPGSCLKTAQWLKSRGSIPVKQQQQQKPKYNSFELLAMRENGIPIPEYDVEVSS